MRDQAIAWLLRLRDTPANAQIQRAFADWLAADPAHQSAYRQAQAQWAWMEPFTQQSFPARDAALRYRPPARQSAGRKWLAYGMAATVLLGVGLAIFSPQGWYGLPHSYNTGKGQRQTLVLSDGSELELNTDTEVRVHFNHAQRHVDLIRGEAFFNVIHDAERPFSVQVGNLSVRDIGTAFDVYKQADRVSVAVQEGVVEMVSQGERRELQAGQQLTYSDDHRFAAAPSDITAATAWRQGQLIFNGRRLVEVLAEIGRYHDVQIRLPDPKLAELRVNGSFRTEQLDSMLNAVATLLPISVKRIGEREIVLEALSGKH
ncbi:iron dicitrate transport regulator FecR [Methylomonas methanica]|uniref:Iron dicitrate transport regulator FecR n=2 Tax=Methylomonas TaxID=416 RepID=A0A126T3T4_9GAMM|nr:iron dicitrate transport regulator FecR [Methylomonas denitrificans]OAI00077.1 iron dicitrate transport regulator FecR [Methylomonas methanica]